MEVAKTIELGRIDEFMQMVKRKWKCINTERTNLISVVIKEEIKSKIVTSFKILECSEKDS